MLEGFVPFSLRLAGGHFSRGCLLKDPLSTQRFPVRRNERSGESGKDLEEFMRENSTEEHCSLCDTVSVIIITLHSGFEKNSLCPIFLAAKRCSGQLTNSSEL